VRTTLCNGPSGAGHVLKKKRKGSREFGWGLLRYLSTTMPKEQKWLLAIFGLKKWGQHRAWKALNSTGRNLSKTKGEGTQGAKGLTKRPYKGKEPSKEKGEKKKRPDTAWGGRGVSVHCKDDRGGRKT